MRCSNCGSNEPDTAKFCSECGGPLLSSATAPTPPPSWSPPPTQWAPPPAPATDYDALRRVSAEQRSFTTPAVITLVLYLVLWLPGLIANIVYLNEANNVERMAGRAPEGKGCLIAMLIVFVGLPVIGICLFLGLGIIGALAG